MLHEQAFAQPCAAPRGTIKSWAARTILVPVSNGAFGLSTPTDLLAKLRHDYEILARRPNDAYAAFNFFVTAEHLVDWIHPIDKSSRNTLRSDPLLAVVSHLANGAKHFGPLSAHHVSVKSSGQTGGFFPAKYFGPRFFSGIFGGGRRLSVTLDGPAAAAFGPTLTAIDLATKVLAYWETPGLVK